MFQARPDSATGLPPPGSAPGAAKHGTESLHNAKRTIRHAMYANGSSCAYACHRDTNELLAVGTEEPEQNLRKATVANGSLNMPARRVFAGTTGICEHDGLG